MERFRVIEPQPSGRGREGLCGGEKMFWQEKREKKDEKRRMRKSDEKNRGQWFFCADLL
jgi:hypothetical protein